MSDFEDVFDEHDTQAVLTQEGLGAVGDLFEFYNEALDEATKWIYELIAKDGVNVLSESEIRGVITARVKNFPLDTIVNKLEALSDFQETLNKSGEQA